MDELIARLEAASEGDTGLRVIGGLDDQIWRLVNDKQWFFTGWQYDLKEAPRYTTSIDAALTLVPEGWFIKLRCGKPVGAEGEFCHCELDCDADSIGRDLDDDEPMYAKALNAPTLPLALCIAALRARSHTAPQEK